MKRRGNSNAKLAKNVFNFKIIILQKANNVVCRVFLPMICISDSEYFYFYYVDFQLAVSVYISVTPIKSNASTTEHTGVTC